ncbi:phage holin family protein [Patescibacteria group bacterium]
MRKILKQWFLNAVIFSFITEIYPGLQINQGLQGIAIASIAYTLLNRFLRPLLKTLLLPITLLTLGTLKWIINVINIAILTLIVPQFIVDKFYFNGLEYGGVIIKGFTVSFFISLVIIAVLHILIKKLILKIMVNPQ